MIYGVYAAIHNNRNIVSASQSGGAFTALSDVILDMGGVVYGCVLDRKFRAVHMRADNKAQRDLMRGSKYVQSDLGSTFSQIKADLAAGRTVLFSGTPCQTAGLKKFIGDKGERLYCADIICHGVPSPAVWKSYLKWQQSRKRRRITDAVFRNKEGHGWHSQFEKISFEDGTEVSSNVYANIFYSLYPMRPSCYNCHFKSLKRQGDITIADCWGIDKIAPELDDNTGISLMLINSQKGQELFDKTEDNMFIKPLKTEDVLQPDLKEPFPEPEDRDVFWQEYRTKSFGYIARKYGRYGADRTPKMLVKRAVGKIRRIIR